MRQIVKLSVKSQFKFKGRINLVYPVRFFSLCNLCGLFY
jgi:hypothetical protein